MKIIYYLSDELDKIEMEMLVRNYRSQSSFHNGADKVRYRINGKKWQETSLKAFNEKAIHYGWKSFDKETVEMLGI